jgi:hypothetical protein
MGKWTVAALVHLNLEVDVEAGSGEEARDKARAALEELHPAAAHVDVTDWWEER